MIRGLVFQESLLHLVARVSEEENHVDRHTRPDIAGHTCFMYAVPAEGQTRTQTTRPERPETKPCVYD